MPKGNICVTDIKKSGSEKLVEIKIDFREHFSGVIKSSTMHKLTGELCLKSFPLFYPGLAIYLFIYLSIYSFIYLFIHYCIFWKVYEKIPPHFILELKQTFCVKVIVQLKKQLRLALSPKF